MQNFSDPQIFENDFPRRQPKHFRDRDGRPLVRDRNSFRNSKIACKIFRTRKILKTIFHGAHKTPRDRDRDPLVCDRDLLWILKFACKIFRFHKFLKTISHGASPNTLGIGMGALWYAIGIHFKILKSHANFSDPLDFENDFPRRPPNTLGIGIGTLWYAKRVYFGILKSHAKFFASANF